MAARISKSYPVPTVDEFTEALSQESDWYSLGVFLGASHQELNEISQNRRDDETMAGCLSDLYQYLQRNEKPLSWNVIIIALKRIGNFSLVNRIRANYQTKPICPVPETKPEPRPPLTGVEAEIETVMIVGYEYVDIMDDYDILKGNIKRAFKNASYVDITEVQDLARRQCGLPSLPRPLATMDAVFNRIEEQCSIVNFHILSFLVDNLLEDNGELKKEIAKVKEKVEHLKASENMMDLVALSKRKVAEARAEQKMVKLKVREFWSSFTMKQFELIINEIFHTLYDILTHCNVTKGCVCITWTMPDIDVTELLPVLPLELVRLIGVIYLHIGDDVIYNIEGEGCESIEAAMIQAIELKNTRAIELLLAVGCNPEVATYNGDNAVTNIVNIRAIESKESSSSGSSHSVDHVCILGHNKHVEAIVDPASGGGEPEECSSCKKMNKQLHQDFNAQQQESNETVLLEKLKLKDAENALLRRTNQSLMEQSKQTDSMMQKMAEELAITKEQLQEKSNELESLYAEIALLKKQQLDERMVLKDSLRQFIRQSEDELMKERLPSAYPWILERTEEIKL